MKTSLFDFDLPESLIATHPASPRDSARMLAVFPPPAGGRPGGGHFVTPEQASPHPNLPPAGEGNFLQDKIIRDLPQFLNPGDVMVFNDTKVIPARLFGKRGEAKVEVLLHKRQGEYWTCFAKPAKRLNPGDRIDFADDFHATVMEKLPDGEVVLSFSPLSRVSGGGPGRGAISELGASGNPPP